MSTLCSHFICSKIAALAQEHATELAAYGITPEAISAVENASEQLRIATDKQTRKTAEDKTARNQISGTFDAIDSILKEELDPLIGLIKTKDNSVYQHYQAVRKIKDLGGGHRTKTADPVVPPQPAKEPVLANAA